MEAAASSELRSDDDDDEDAPLVAADVMLTVDWAAES